MEDAKNAVRYMIDWLVETQGLTRSQPTSCAARTAT